MECRQEGGSPTKCAETVGACLYCLAVDEVETHPDIPDLARELALMSLRAGPVGCECSDEQR